MVICGIYMVKTFTLPKKKGFYKAWTALLFLNIVGFVFTAQLSDTEQFNMFKNTLVGLLSFYPFYYFASKNRLDSKELLIFFMIMLPIAIAQFFYSKTLILSESNSSNEDIVNNAAYKFVVLFPFVFLIKKKKVISAVFVLLILFFIIAGSKRGAVVVGSVILLWYFYYQMKMIDEKNKWKGYLLSFVSIAVIAFLGYKYFLNNENLVYRLELAAQGDTSNRNLIYSNIWNTWLNSDSFHFLFGYGFAASIKVSKLGLFAHNDWLEILSNFGLLGVIILATLFYQGFKLCFNKEWSSDKRILMAAIISSAFATTLFSMWYTSLGTYLNTMLLAYLVGNKYEKLT
jgi:O-antigen ligase